MILILAIFFIGTAIGSFLNVLIDRLPNEESINGRSHCDYCKKKIAWYDMFPVLSFFILGGKTRCCQKKLSFQYPLIEIITGLAFALITNYQIPITKQILITDYQLPNIWLFSHWSLFVSWLSLLGLFCSFIVIFVSDLKYHLISDYIQAAFLIFSIIYHLGSSISISPFVNYIVSAMVVALPIWLIYFLSKERAMGLGDVYLALNLGFLLDWEAGFLALYIAFVIGAIFGLALLLLKKKKIKSKVSFGPFIIIGIITMLFWQKEIFQLVSRIYGF